MNLQHHVQDYSPVSSSLDQQQDEHALRHGDGWSHILPPLLKCSGGLANIPQSTLRENLKPVVTALERLDAELLLHLQSAEQGARVREG